MLLFRQMKSPQKFASIHASLHNHFAQDRHVIDCTTFKNRRSAALADACCVRASAHEQDLPSGDEFALD
jgi:hypothetical protein